MYVFERHDVCLNARVEVRGQFAVVSSPRYHIGPIDQTQVIRLAEQMLLPTELPHLAILIKIRETIIAK